MENVHFVTLLVPWNLTDFSSMQICRKCGRFFPTHYNQNPNYFIVYNYSFFQHCDLKIVHNLLSKLFFRVQSLNNFRFQLKSLSFHLDFDKIRVFSFIKINRVSKGENFSNFLEFKMRSRDYSFKIAH